MPNKPTNVKIPVALIEDFKYFRNHLVNGLKLSKGISVVHDSANGKEAIEGIYYKKPEIVIINLPLPVKNGFEIIAEINNTNPEIKIIVYSANLNPMINAKLVGKGVCGILDTTFDLSILKNAITDVNKFEHYFNLYHTKAIVDFLKDPKMNDNYLMLDDIVLSKHEIDIMVLLWDGFTKEELAEEFHNSLKSNQTHVLALINKFKGKTIAKVFKYGLNNGILSLKD